MFFHIGNNYAISDYWVIGIFDFDKICAAKSETVDFLKKAEQEQKIENISLEIPKSIIVALDRVYLSPISADILKERIQRARRLGEKEHARKRK